MEVPRHSWLNHFPTHLLPKAPNQVQFCFRHQDQGRESEVKSSSWAEQKENSLGQGCEELPALPCSSVQSLNCVWLCDRMNCSMPGLPVHHQFPEPTQTHVHHVSDAIQPSHPLSSPSPAFNLSQHHGLFQWVSSSHQVVKVLEFQLQHQSFQWILSTDFF